MNFQPGNTLLTMWALVVIAIAVAAGTASAAGWIAAMVVALTPPFIIMRLRQTNGPSLSETIDRARR